MAPLRAVLHELPDSVARAVEPALREAGVAVSRRRRFEPLEGAAFDLVLAPRVGAEGAIDAEAIRAWKRLPGAPEVVVLVDEELGEERAVLLGAGCLALLDWTVAPAALGAAVRSLVARCAELIEQRRPAAAGRPVPRLDPASTRSAAMRRALELARKVALFDSTVLLLGETGVGKEWLARAIHEEGSRASGPFVAVNCAAVPESLLESELFGHEKGAFTGALRERRGVFEQAHGGTLFLDEIAEMSPHLQSKLLRVLQDRTVQRVGSERSFRVDVRLLAATSRALSEAIAQGTFRQDLYYRVAVISLEIPALRERREDVATLAQGFVEHFRARMETTVNGLSEEAVRALEEHSWPGNVRELLNTIERCVLLAEGPRIEVEDLGSLAGDVSVAAGSRVGTGRDDAPGAWTEEWFARPLAAVRRDATAELERAYLTRLLRRAGGRVGRAAEQAEVHPRSLYELMRRHGMRKEEFRSGEGSCAAGPSAGRGEAPQNASVSPTLPNAPSSLR
jgi:DNA-binding NtrC family response regulator